MPFPEPPVVTHLGKIDGEWVIRVFSDENSALHWAVEGSRNHAKRRVWPVLSIELGDPRTARTETIRDWVS